MKKSRKTRKFNGKLILQKVWVSLCALVVLNSSVNFSELSFSPTYLPQNPSNSTLHHNTTALEEASDKDFGDFLQEDLEDLSQKDFGGLLQEVEYNEIETIYELITELALDWEDHVPENQQNDEEDLRKFIPWVWNCYKFPLEAPSNYTRTTQQIYPVKIGALEKMYGKIPTPPPDYWSTKFII